MLKKYISINFLKTKRTNIRKILIIFPFLLIMLNFLLFIGTGYLSPSIVNQWSFIGMNMFLAIIISMISLNDKKINYSQVVKSLPIDEVKFELSNIIHGIFISIVVSIFLTILVLITLPFTEFFIPIGHYIISIWGIFICTLWMIPFYLFVNRRSNWAISFFVALLGTALRLNPDSLLGKMDPFDWGAIFVVPWIKMNINGVPLNDDTSYIIWPINVSIIFFFVILYFDLLAYKKEFYHERNI